MATATSNVWPALPLKDWNDTYATLHRWTQIVGKVRLTRSPWVNHSWHVALYVTPRGLTTSAIPHGKQSFEIEFDFIDHQLIVRTSSGAVRNKPLRSESVATFYHETMATLCDLGVPVSINPKPNELEDATPFPLDDKRASYDADAVHRFWQSLVQVDRVLKAFRARFIGKCSPVHFFWGSFDLAVTRFSGRPAPRHPGGVPNLPDWVAREAYSHEVSSAGFWPGGSGVEYAAFYSYAYPEPAGFKDAKVGPADAYYHPKLREFLLPYDAVRTASDPDAALMEFLQSTYEAAAIAAKWDRAELERMVDPRVASRASRG
jgi:hypothetical protein